MQIDLPSGQTVDSQHVEWYVLGASYDYLTSTGQLHLRDNTDKFNAFNQRVLEKVTAYLRGNSSLNGTYSDFECIVSTKLFRFLKERT